MKKAVLLTGAAGFIGAQTAHELLALGHNVVGIDNLNDYYDIRIKEHRLQELKKNQKFEFITGDIENKSILREIFNQYQITHVLNLAARAGVRYSMENPDVYLSTNMNGTLNLLTCMKDYGVKKIVLASTSSLYAGQPLPFVEELAVNNPISPYAASKKAAEVMAYTYHHLYNIDVSVVRYFTVYGPAGRPDMAIFRFIRWIDEGTPITLFGDGSQSRDFTYVTDVAKGTIKAMKEVGYEIINIGGGKNPISLKYVISEIENHLNKKAKINNKPFHQADMVETWANIKKAEKMLDWKPNITFQEGLKNCIDWYLENKELCQSITL